MGNRCTITRPQKDVYIYLHWNGGRDSVEAFLEYCRLPQLPQPGVRTAMVSPVLRRSSPTSLAAV